MGGPNGIYRLHQLADDVHHQSLSDHPCLFHIHADAISAASWSFMMVGYLILVGRSIKVSNLMVD